jgi:hypothetical protein
VLKSWNFTSEDHVPLTVWVLSMAETKTLPSLVAMVLDDQGWNKWCKDLGPEFSKSLKGSGVGQRDEKLLAQTKALMTTENLAFAAIVPRGVGPHAWAAPDSVDERHIRRRFALIGQTLDGQRVWDTRRALAVLKTVFPAKTSLQAEGDAAVWALYAAIIEPEVLSLTLRHPPASHKGGPVLLNVLKHFDIPQALALVGDRPITVTLKAEADKAAWDWTVQHQTLLRRSKISWRVDP